MFKTALCSYYPLLTKPALFRKDTVIVQLRCRYRSAKVSILLVLHGRDEIFPRLWQYLTTAVRRSYHGRGKVKIAAPLPNYTGTLIKLYRYTYSTIQTYLLNCTGIRMQLYQNLKTTIPRCQHNYTIKKQADNRTLNSYCQPIVSFYCQHILYCNSLL